jgi:hypothetical protein
MFLCLQSLSLIERYECAYVGVEEHVKLGSLSFTAVIASGNETGSLLYLARRKIYLSPLSTC